MVLAAFISENWYVLLNIFCRLHGEISTNLKHLWAPIKSEAIRKLHPEKLR